MDNSNKIAIVGVGCRFPGADNVEEFWRVLVNGEDHVKDIPQERFDIDAIYDPNPNAIGKTYVKKAGLLSNIGQWDNRFFGISDTEAEHMDPQQHLVLECTHMALEDGGITRHRLAGSDTGVYIGVMNNDFKAQTKTENIRNYTVTGVHSSIISARVSYFYDLQGPSLVIDTACSSSLVAIHAACQAIKAGDISMAVCGGVSAITDPSVFVTLSKARMASPTGKCHTFSKEADGYARGEGCGIVIVKSLTNAMKDGNKIWGTIITGCNQDGHAITPITAPSQSQQIKLLQKVYKDNKIDVNLIQYIEAHDVMIEAGNGYIKPTKIKVDENCQIVKIQWGKKYGHSLPLKDISAISPVSRDGLHGIKMRSRKERTFFTKDRRLRDALMIHLQNSGCDLENQNTYF